MKEEMRTQGTNCLFTMVVITLEKMTKVENKATKQSEDCIQTTCTFSVDVKFQNNQQKTVAEVGHTTSLLLTM